MLRLLLHSYGQFDPRHPIKPTLWPHFDLFFVHSGRMELQAGEHPKFRLKAGEGVLIYPYTRFSGRTVGARPVRASVQHFALDEAGAGHAFFRQFASRRDGHALLQGRAARRCRADVERAMELATQSGGAATLVLREAQLTLLLGALCTGERMAQARATGAESLYQVMTRAQIEGGSASVTELARRAGYSPGHFRTLFRAQFHQRPAEFLALLRINEAKRLLRETRKPIKEIAREIGYGDAVAFHRAFARETRNTPMSFRRRFSPRG